ncbi:Hypothetical predicted protein [Olea europaea subsp. europaea]|uniref:Uncharacterized protein n=1 Tax=Olea europaea subsp. europaea TaxID=158383 RepID=A0A8S0Q319_OLEEU|nr:Hypothetical predicted protein [Olea europaea subsp. europaea]
MCRPCPGRVLAAAGTQPDFQAFLANLWARCASNVWDASRSRKGRKQIFNQMKKARCAGDVRGADRFPGILGSFWDTMRRIYSGQVIATAGTQPNFLAFFDSFWALCASHVRDASWP